MKRVYRERIFHDETEYNQHIGEICGNPDLISDERDPYEAQIHKDHELWKAGTLQGLWALMGKLLTPKQREVMQLVYKEGLSERQIAKKLGIDVRAVHDRRTQSEKKLKKYLSQNTQQ